MRKVKLALQILVFKCICMFAGKGKEFDNTAFFVTDVNDTLQGNMESIYNFIKEKGITCKVFCKSKQKNGLTLSDVAAIAKGLKSSKYVLLEDVLNFLEFYTPNDNQEIIQLWHGAGAYKMFGFSRPDGMSGQVRVSKGHRKYTWAIVSSEEIRWCYAEAFGIDQDRVVATGIPRTDVFFEDDAMAKARDAFNVKYPEAAGKILVLFAPTYRGNRISEATYAFNMIEPEMFKKQLGDEYVFATKWHPALQNNILLGRQKAFDEDAYDEHFIDISAEGNMNQLLMAADILVTDYSSLIFEYSLMDKPIVYFAYDMDEYKKSRGLYFSFDEYVFGAVTRNQDELVSAIKREDLMEEKRLGFRNKFMESCKGNSTENVWHMLGRN